MPLFFQNLRRFFREVSETPFSDLPATLAGYAKPKIEKTIETGAFRLGVMNLLSSRFRGPGIALMFHEIQTDVEGELLTGCPPEQLRDILRAIKSDGRDVVSVEEGLERLGQKNPKPFVLLTFDDAYRDNLENALPVLEEFAAPTTLFVPTGMINRQLDVWWLELRAVLKCRNTFAFPPMDREFACADTASKAAALRQVTAWVGTDQVRVKELTETLASYGLSKASLIDHYAMDETTLKQFAAHPLITIGAHTTTHRFMSHLSADEVMREFKENKRYLENLIGQSVEFLAYPYGTEGACGKREANLAKEAGFKAAFTTRPGHLFAEHLKLPHLLPRIDVGYYPQRRSALASRISGFQRAMLTGWKDPVASLS